MYVTASGWIRLDHRLRDAVEDVIARHPHELYAGGWVFPASPFNWSLQVFYGGDIREGAVDWLRAAVEDVAALPPVDDDGDRPRGVFLLNDERGGAVHWVVRNGRVSVNEAPEFAWLGS